MKGKHKHKWDYLRELLQEKVVYDDLIPRVWFADELHTQGVLYSCKQAQLHLDKPTGKWRVEYSTEKYSRDLNTVLGCEDCNLNLRQAKCLPMMGKGLLTPTSRHSSICTSHSVDR